MLKGVSALLCGAGIVLLASGSVYAQTTTTNKRAAAVSDAEITSAVKTRLLADRLVGGRPEKATVMWATAPPYPTSESSYSPSAVAAVIA